MVEDGECMGIGVVVRVAWRGTIVDGVDEWDVQREGVFVGGTTGAGNAGCPKGGGGGGSRAAGKEEQPREDEIGSAVEVAAEPRADEQRADEQQQQRGGDADKWSPLPPHRRSAQRVRELRAADAVAIVVRRR